MLLTFSKSGAVKTTSKSELVSGWYEDVYISLDKFVSVNTMKTADEIRKNISVLNEILECLENKND